jgi:hypothetical protein
LRYTFPIVELDYLGVSIWVKKSKLLADSQPDVLIINENKTLNSFSAVKTKQVGRMKMMQLFTPDHS